jgi:hypothetical protein
VLRAFLQLECRKEFSSTMIDVGASASVPIKGAKKLLIFLVALSILAFTFSFSERSTFYKMSATQNTYEH